MQAFGGKASGGKRTGQLREILKEQKPTMMKKGCEEPCGERGPNASHMRSEQSQTHAGGVPRPRSASEPRGCARGLALAARRARRACAQALLRAHARQLHPRAAAHRWGPNGSQWGPWGPMERGAPRSKTMRSAARSSLCRPSRNVRRYLPHANQPPAGHAARGCGRRLCSRRSCVCRAMPRLAAVARLPMPLAHAERISRHGGETH